MSTGCKCTLTNNVDEGSHKDIAGMASRPVVVSKSWQVQVDSLKVTDVAAFLTAIKNCTPFRLMWDETSTENNYDAEGADFNRTGLAYLNDFTMVFNNREFSTKSLQFTGTGELEVESAIEVQAPGASVYTKGEAVRLFLSANNTDTPSAVIAAAKQLSWHASLTLEEATTKDTTGDWQVMEPTALAYDFSTTALMKTDETITSSVDAKDLADIETLYDNGTPVKWLIANVSGANNRTKGAVIVNGSCIVKSLDMNGPNRQNADYTASFVGVGDLTVGA